MKNIVNDEDVGYIGFRLDLATERIHDQYFGARKPPTPPPAPVVDNDAEIRRKQELEA
jgi:hypothetical protein